MAFVVTAVTGLEKEAPKKQTPDSSDATGQGDEPANVTTEETQSADVQPNETSKVRPGVAFWIAIKTHDCMLQKLEGMFVNMFLACGFSVYHCKVIKFKYCYYCYLKINVLEHI